MKTRFGILLALAVVAVAGVSSARAGQAYENCEKWECNPCNPCEPKDCNPPGGGDTPEPASLSMLAIGGAALLLRRRAGK